MLEESTNYPLSKKMMSLVVGLWAFMAFFSFIFVLLVFRFSGDQQVFFGWVFLIGSFIACAISVFLAQRMCAPIIEIGRSQASSEEELRTGLSAARSLSLKMGTTGFLGPLCLFFIIGLLMTQSRGLLSGQIFYFLVLGLFAAMFMGSISMFVAQKWTGQFLSSLLVPIKLVQGGRGVSLRLKMVILGFGLAFVPTLLVGSMSYYTATRLLASEMGDSLAGKLKQIGKQVSSLIESGLGRTEVETYLSDEVEKISPDTFIYFGSLNGKDFYRSSKATALPGGLLEVLAQTAKTSEIGNVIDPITATVFAYAVTMEGVKVKGQSTTWLTISPLPETELVKTTRTLLFLIVGITMFSMLLAFIISFVFASNIGDMVKDMALVTGEVARGKLTRDVRILSDDEMGALGESLSTMTENLRHMVQGMTSLAGQIASTCNQLLVKSAAISTGAEVQSQSVNETSESVGELNSNIQAASDNLQSLAQSARETSEAAKKVGESFNLMLAETGSMQKTVERTGEIVGRMVSLVTQVSGGIAELGRGAERSAVSMAEMDRSISEVAASASETTQIARKAIDVAQNGAQAVRRTIEGMDRIVKSTRDASSVIVGLGNRIEDIGSILGVIDEIADQTNLLALNAAIIAAQAGEHGRSFAVVADEIRSLAERTAASTREISKMIADIQQTSEEAIKVMKGGGTIVNEGVALSQQAGDALQQILGSFQKAAENVEAIAAYTEGQAKSSMTVAQEISHVAQIASQIAHAATEQTRAGDELQSAFQDTLKTSLSLNKLVNQQSQENRLAIAAMAEINESTTRANQALLDQSKVSDGILQAIEQVREIAKNHAKAASEMGEATQLLAEKSSRLKDEIGGFQT